MRLIKLLLLTIFITPAFSQEETVYFSDAIKPHLVKYNLQSDIQFEKGDIAKGQFLFDSLVKNFLVGSRFTDYSFKSLNSRKVKLSKIKKPVFIITYASWCVMNKGEITALNKLSKKYSKDVRFIALFWDKKENVKKVSRKFNSHITVCYANESYRNDSRIVSTLKHTLGFPTSYFLNSNLDVVDIRRGGIPTSPKTSSRDAYMQNYKVFNDMLTDCLLKKDLIQLATVTED